ncbi:MAG: FeS-binding protein [Deltaproteobacteria bacterium]|nr:FeS-binding protein [Deltaproteobacteria bacterium]
MQDTPPEILARSVMEACADCDICRHLMADTPCLFFPRLYELFDREWEGEDSVSPEELKKLVELCNFCALCPCPNIRADIMKAKEAFVARDGLKPGIRLLEDVERLARVCGAYPRLTNMLLDKGATGRILKRLAGIHPDRRVPVFPRAGFPAWAVEQGLHVKGRGGGSKVAYFAGCTGQYLFPGVPQAAVQVLRENGVEIYWPEQSCCGMPSLLEGDAQLTLECVSKNLESLSDAVDSGYDIVCSCPTCGFMLKHFLVEGAHYSDANRQADAARGREPNERDMGPKEIGNTTGSFRASIMDGLFKDEGIFASLNPLKRIRVAKSTFDLGEYLMNLQRAVEFKSNLGRIQVRVAYYPPCHLWEQKIGEPYVDLLNLVPGITLERIDGAFLCCGIAGIMGFKESFHHESVKIGSR